MIFTKTPLEGAFLIDLEPIGDERGFFARSFCRREFEAHGLNPDLAQCNISLNLRQGTLRGMHWQVVPHQEAKLVRCTRGAIHDVIIDLRQDSPTFTAHFSADLQMYSFNANSPDPQRFMDPFVSWEIAQKANKWAGLNSSRWHHDEYDRLARAAQTEMDPVKRAAIYIRMNDLIVQNVVVMHRLSDLAAAGAAGSRERELAEGLLHDAQTRVIYRQVPDNVAPTRELLGLTSVEADLLPELDDGVALWKVGNRSFLVQHQLSSIEIPLVDTDRRMVGGSGRWDR